MAHDVFISYSSKDKPVADAAVAALEARGIRCWIAPRDIIAGVDWSEALIEAIEGSSCVLLVYSQHANESQQIKREVERAVAKGIPIIPLRLEDVPMAKNLEYFISMPHWIDALTEERRRNLAYLADTVSLLLDRQRGRAPASPRQAARAPDSTPAASRPAWRILVGAAAILIAALAVILRPKPDDRDPAPVPTAPEPSPPAPTQAAGPTQAAPARSPSLDPRLIGRWAATITAQGVASDHLVEIGDDGAYAWHAEITDGGTLQAGNGGILQSSRKNGTFPQGYRFDGADAVTITGPTGVSQWRRSTSSEGGSPTLDSLLSGTWVMDFTDPSGNAWKGTWHVAATGAYDFRMVADDRGKMTASSGRYRVTSQQHPRPREGSYAFESESRMRMGEDGASVGGTWHRKD